MKTKDSNCIIDSATVLGIINITCGLLHAVFQRVLTSATGAFREFILIENMLICFVFIGFGIALLFGGNHTKRIACMSQLAWWLFFIGLVLIYNNAVTTLSMFPWLPVREAPALVITSVLASILCLTGIKKRHSI